MPTNKKKTERALTELQKKALEKLTPEWKQAPLLVKSTVLLSLKNRGLVEARLNRKFVSLVCFLPYTSFRYQWRLAPAAKNG